jgi:membrane protease YdiL (CAAX protease family)
MQLVLFQLAEEIGFTGFLQHHWQDRSHPMKLTVYVALLWAVLHLPDHFAEEGWGSGADLGLPSSSPSSSSRCPSPAPCSCGSTT